MAAGPWQDYLGRATQENIMSALRKTAPLPAAEVPGLAYYTPAAANVPARPLPVLSALEQMYAYWTRT